MSQISFIARAMTSWKPLHVSGTVLQIIEEFVLVLRIRTFLGLPLKCRTLYGSGSGSESGSSHQTSVADLGFLSRTSFVIFEY
jgi:hypothetical protein